MNCNYSLCKDYNENFECNCERHTNPAVDCEAFMLNEEPQTKYDPQSRYYDVGGIEVQEIIKAKLTREQYFGWLLGNVIKYSTRLNFKGQNVRDTQKMANYAAWAQDFMVEEAEQ